LVRHMAVGLLGGFLIGLLLLHPASMVFREMVHPSPRLNLQALGGAFSAVHMPMAVFFALLGAAIGGLNGLYILLLLRQRRRIKLLEGLLPICAYCKRIRDDGGGPKGSGIWMEVEQYLQAKASAEFTHGICPVCYEKVMKEIEAA